jgi:hypothetical protein
MVDTGGSRICSRCRLRPSSGKHAWCTRCKHGRGGPAAPDARTRKRGNIENITANADAGDAAIEGNDQHEGNSASGGQALAKGTGQATGQDPSLALISHLEGHDRHPPTARPLGELREPTAHADAPAQAITTTGQSSAKEVASATSSTTHDTRADFASIVRIVPAPKKDEAATIPPVGGDDSFPPSLVGFAPVWLIPKKSERGTRGEQDISRVSCPVERSASRVSDVVGAPEKERCLTPNVRAISTSLALCLSCWRRDLVGRLTADHERGDTARCDSADLEPFAGGRWTRCRLCGSAGQHDLMAAPHPIGRPVTSS